MDVQLKSIRRAITHCSVNGRPEQNPPSGQEHVSARYVMSNCELWAIWPTAVVLGEERLAHQLMCRAVC